MRTYDELITLTRQGDIPAAMELCRLASKRADWMSVKLACDVLVGDVAWLVMLDDAVSCETLGEIAAQIGESLKSGVLVVSDVERLKFRVLPIPRLALVRRQGSDVPSITVELVGVQDHGDS